MKLEIYIKKYEQKNVIYLTICLMSSSRRVLVQGMYLDDFSYQSVVSFNDRLYRVLILEVSAFLIKVPQGGQSIYCMKKYNNIYI